MTAPTEPIITSAPDTMDGEPSAWVVVPRVADDAMIEAAEEANVDYRLTNLSATAHLGPAGVYTAMLAARPVPALTEDVVERVARAFRDAWVKMPSVCADPWDELGFQRQGEIIAAMRAALTALGLEA